MTPEKAEILKLVEVAKKISKEKYGYVKKEEFEHAAKARELEIENVIKIQSIANSIVFTRIILLEKINQNEDVDYLDNIEERFIERGIKSFYDFTDIDK